MNLAFDKKQIAFTIIAVCATQFTQAGYLNRATQASKQAYCRFATELQQAAKTTPVIAQFEQSVKFMPKLPQSIYNGHKSSMLGKRFMSTHEDFSTIKDAIVREFINKYTAKRTVADTFLLKLLPKLDFKKLPFAMQNPKNKTEFVNLLEKELQIHSNALAKASEETTFDEKNAIAKTIQQIYSAKPTQVGTVNRNVKEKYDKIYAEMLAAEAAKKAAFQRSLDEMRTAENAKIKEILEAFNKWKENEQRTELIRQAEFKDQLKKKIAAQKIVFADNAVTHAQVEKFKSTIEAEIAEEKERIKWTQDDWRFQEQETIGKMNKKEESLNKKIEELTNEENIRAKHAHYHIQFQRQDGENIVEAFTGFENWADSLKDL